MDHAITAGIHDTIHFNVQVWPILFSTAFVVDFLGSVGLVGLCAAVFDPLIFIVVLALTIFCATGFLITTIWSVAEKLVYRRYKGSKWLWDVLSAHWKRTMGILSFRVAIQTLHGIGHGIVGIMCHLNESVKRFFYRIGGRSAVLPITVNSNWNTAKVKLRAVSRMARGQAGHDDEGMAVSYQVVKGIHEEEKVKNAARFWQPPHNGDCVPLHVIKTHAHRDAIK